MEEQLFPTLGRCYKISMRDIKALVKCCLKCLNLLPVNSKEPLQQPPLPTRPWEKLGVDLCSLHGNKYLIFTEVHDLRKDATAPLLIKELKKIRWYLF